MKVITKIDGIDLLNMIANDQLECGTMIRHKREDAILASNLPQPIYEYYKYTAGDKKFHRCDEKGKLGSIGQQRFMNYSTLNKTFEIVEMEEETLKDLMDDLESLRVELEKDKDITKLEKSNVFEIDINNPLGRLEHHYEQTKDEVCEKINEIIDKVNKLKNK